MIKVAKLQGRANERERFDTRNSAVNCDRSIVKQPAQDRMLNVHTFDLCPCSFRPRDATIGLLGPRDAIAELYIDKLVVVNYTNMWTAGATLLAAGAECGTVRYAWEHPMVSPHGGSSDEAA